MRYLFICLLLICAACGGKSKAPQYASVFTDDSAPCVKLRFQGPVRLNSVDDEKDKKKDTESLIYSFTVANHQEEQVTLTKIHTKGDNFSYAPLSGIYDAQEIIYEIPYMAEHSGKTGGVVLVMKKEGLFLSAVVEGLLSQTDKYLFSSDTLIQKSEYLHAFNLENWKKSPTGQIFMRNAKSQAEWYFLNIAPAECK